MPKSQAYQDFQASIGVAEELLRLERGYPNPPRAANDLRAIQGLRGGTAILIVASFESFLRKAVEEHMQRLSSKHTTLRFEDLPDDIKTTAYYSSLELAMKGAPAAKRIDRLPAIKAAAKRVASNEIDPTCFNETRSNPNPDTVKRLFKDLGLPNILTRIKPRFDKRWNTKGPTASTFLDDKLAEIVNRRHRVAHTADAQNISRKDLLESLRFLKLLASFLDSELQKHISHLIKTHS